MAEQFREWKIKVDWTRDIASRVPVPQFVQGDTVAVRLSIEMVNDRAIIDITPNYRLMVLIVRPDGQALLEEATLIDGNSAEYIFPGNALEISGKARVHLGLFGTAGERLTHEKALDFFIGEDPGFCEDDAIIAATEYGVLSQLIQEVGVLQTAAGLQYIWDEDRLGIKRADEEEYTYSPPLTGPQGVSGEVSGNILWTNVIDKPPLLEDFDENTLSHVHIQGRAQSVWYVHHALNKKEISVTVYDSTGRQVIGEVVLIDPNNAELHFIGGFSGTAYVV